MRTNNGVDLQSRALLALTNALTGTGTTAPTSTTITLDDQTSPGSTSVWNGQQITCGATWGVVKSNTNATPPVVTIDQWYTPASPGGAAASTPSAGRYHVNPGMVPAQFMAITTDTGAPSASDTTLTSEETTNGLARAYATYAHTTAGGTATLTKTFTYTGSTSKTLHKIGIFQGVTGTIMFFETVLSADAIVATNGDQVTVTETVTF